MISVIVPVHNIEAYLSRCLDSILDQTERDIEIIIIDDGSDDSSPFIIDSYASADERIRVLRTEYRGVSSARNTGIREAKGEYIGFVDADDFAEPDMFEALRSRLEETCSDVSFCGFINEYPLRSVPSAVYEKVYSGEEVMKA
ncbi:MAG: glycosyltransferase, partial [Eubacteriaceae bacterium]|nr:glycosyltransferase [Eubacteriaceae bacterium]